MRLLLIEDDELLASSLAAGLRAEGFAVDRSGDGIEGLYLASEHEYDVVVLDVLLPGMNGFKVVSELRAAGRTAPVLMLTAKGGEWDQAEGLDSGADDYLVKPFHYQVLLAHLRALLRRGAGRPGPALQAGDLRLDPVSHRVWRGADEVELTPREFDVLRYLLSRPGEVVTKQELLDHVWGDLDGGDANVVEVYVHYLRRKLDAPFGRATIQTVRGVGYRIADA
ncbi:MAG TPA: response regulator transcription factor [Acidimicrobiales bacterium]|nr:response regulator transcription factor [Acidimicrobiales bacterium]